MTKRTWDTLFTEIKVIAQNKGKKNRDNIIRVITERLKRMIQLVDNDYSTKFFVAYILCSIGSKLGLEDHFVLNATDNLIGETTNSDKKRG